MAPSHVLRIPILDADGTFVLVHTTQVRSKALDMKLTGTDGLAPYSTTIRHSQAPSFMVKNSPVQEEEWIDVLSKMLRQERVEAMEAVASVDSESAIVITFRKRVGGITQRLGTIELKYNPDEEIELYDWCGMSLEVVAQAQGTLTSVTAKTSELEETVRQLRNQLEELVEAKRSDEAELLEKFRDLLNEKKVRIRQQKNVIDNMEKANPEFIKFETLTQDDAVDVERPAAKSRGGKRKQVVQEEESEDAGFEAMDVDDGPTEQTADASDEDRATTDAGTETASEAEDEDEEKIAADPKPALKARGAKPLSSGRSAQATSSASASQQDDELPAQRELPFARKKQPSRATKVAPPPPPPPAGDETESDDEL